MDITKIRPFLISIGIFIYASLGNSQTNPPGVFADLRKTSNIVGYDTTEFFGDTVYVANSDSDFVYVVDIFSREIIKRIQVGGGQYGIALCRNKGFAISTVAIGNVNGEGAIVIINIPENTVRASIPVEFSKPFDIVLSHDCSVAYISGSAINAIFVVDIALEAIIATIPVQEFPEGLEISPDGSRVYAGNRDSNTISVISTQSNTVIETVNVGLYPHDIAATRDGKYLYVTNQGITTDSLTWTVTVIDAVDLSPIGNIFVGDYAFGITITHDGKYAYIANARSHTVSVIEIERNTVIATIPVWYRPKAVSLSSDSNYVYLATDVGGRVQVIDIATNEVIKTIFVAHGLLKIATYDFKEVKVDTDSVAIVSVMPDFVNTPRSYGLKQNYPNPFNPLTTIEYSLRLPGVVSLAIYNFRGEIITLLVDKDMSAGKHFITWDASNLPSGIYFYRLRTDHFVQTRKMIFLK